MTYCDDAMVLFVSIMTNCDDALVLLDLIVLCVGVIRFDCYYCDCAIV